MQARDVFVSSGISVSDAREIAAEVYRENALKLTEAAQEVAQERAGELTDDFLKRLQSAEIGLELFSDPDLQYSLFAAQRDYARSGKLELKNILVDLLVRRSTTETELEKVVMAEAIETVRKLTSRQVAALTIVWLIRWTRPIGIQSVADLLTYAEEYYTPFVAELPRNNSEYFHIQYTSCGSLGVSHGLGYLVMTQAVGLFQRGFPPNAIPEELWNSAVRGELFVECLHNPDHWQLNVVQEDEVDSLVATTETWHHLPLLNGLLQNYRMSEQDVDKLLADHGGVWPQLMSAWSSTLIGGLRLSSVGIAIAHSNWSAKTGGSAPLSIWIAEAPA